MAQTTSVKAILRTDKKRLDGTCPVCIRVTIDRRTVKLSSTQFVEESNWNFTSTSFKGANMSKANSKLNKRIAEIREYLLNEELFGNVVTIEKVKEHFTNQGGKGFYDVIDQCIKIKFLEINPSTQKHYELVKKRLIEFRPKLSLNEIDLNFIQKFDKFLRAKDIGVDGLWQHHKILKVFIRFALKKKLLKSNPYEDFKVKRGNPKFGYLTEQEIFAIRSLEFPDDEGGRGLELTRDMFLFGCYTGLRYSDVSNIKNTDIIEGSHISIVTQKTGKWVNIPLFENTALIIKKYKSKGRPEIFPNRTNQCCNRDLKFIADECGITKLLTFHMSRHSFATNLVTSNVNPFIVSQLLGHSSMSQTLIYVNANTGDVRKQMENVSLFK
jgi:integrase